jgi:hypothetical protein
MILLFFGFIAAIPISAVVLIRAVGGPRPETQRRCRGCRYDLVDPLPDLCPECGRDTAELASPNYAGHRARYLPLAAVSWLILLVALMILALVYVTDVVRPFTRDLFTLTAEGVLVDRATLNIDSAQASARSQFPTAPSQLRISIIMQRAAGAPWRDGTMTIEYRNIIGIPIRTERLPLPDGQTTIHPAGAGIARGKLIFAKTSAIRGVDLTLGGSKAPGDWLAERVRHSSQHYPTEDSWIWITHRLSTPEGWVWGTWAATQTAEPVFAATWLEWAGDPSRWGPWVTVPPCWLLMGIWIVRRIMRKNPVAAS